MAKFKTDENGWPSEEANSAPATPVEAVQTPIVETPPVVAEPKPTPAPAPAPRVNYSSPDKAQGSAQTAPAEVKSEDGASSSEEGN